MSKTPEEVRRLIDAAIVCADQLVFVYQDGEKDEARYVTPIAIELRAGANVSNLIPSNLIPLDDLMVLCSQHLPEGGYRKFAMNQMKDVTRVISRAF